MGAEGVESLCQHARAALAQRDLDRALQCYQQALTLKASSPDIHYGLATVYFLLNDLPKAAHHFKEVTRLDPSRAGAYINLGSVYYRLDLLDEAIKVLRRGIQLDVRRAEGYYNLGVVYRQKKQLKLALEAYREAVKVNPHLAEAHLNVANIYLEMENLRQAILHYKMALEIRPDWQNAEKGLIAAEEALAAMEQAEEPPPAEAPEPGTGQPEALMPALDPERTVDPNIHGPLLTAVHSSTIDSDSEGRRLVDLLEKEVEPAIKNLSSGLMMSDSSLLELEDRLRKFVSALHAMRGVQRNLEDHLHRVQTLAEQLIRS
jgi:cytochrome c-type biogenesis protein CcmH/NrfG